ncbi:MAG: YHS domain-containing (seleno)protein, partial [Paracoccus sp. (in: a-proteobacteria)]|nr:YHS domain-containing (seleno)protein [Paracoccus sp. (in: a-proteobacteria)]
VSHRCDVTELRVENRVARCHKSSIPTCRGHMRKLITTTLFLTLLAAPAAAQNWALGGHDPVGTVQTGEAVPGRGDIATMWRGEVWHFATEENRARFEADPRAFAPAFGGLCPVALARGEKRPGDPRHFVVISGVLYLLQGGAAMQELRRDPAGILDKARQVWASMD